MGFQINPYLRRRAAFAWAVVLLAGLFAACGTEAPNQSDQDSDGNEPPLDPFVAFWTGSYQGIWERYRYKAIEWPQDETLVGLQGPVEQSDGVGISVDAFADSTAMVSVDTEAREGYAEKTRTRAGSGTSLGAGYYKGHSITHTESFTIDKFGQFVLARYDYTYYGDQLDFDQFLVSYSHEGMRALALPPQVADTASTIWSGQYAATFAGDSLQVRIAPIGADSLSVEIESLLGRTPVQLETGWRAPEFSWTLR